MTEKKEVVQEHSVSTGKGAEEATSDNKPAVIIQDHPIFRKVEDGNLEAIQNLIEVSLFAICLNENILILNGQGTYTRVSIGCAGNTDLK